MLITVKKGIDSGNGSGKAFLSLPGYGGISSPQILQLLVPDLHEVLTKVRKIPQRVFLPRKIDIHKQVEVVRVPAQFVQYLLRGLSENMIAPDFYGDEGGIADQYVTGFGEKGLFKLQLPMEHVNFILPGTGFGKFFTIAPCEFGYPHGLVMAGQLLRKCGFSCRFRPYNSDLFYAPAIFHVLLHCK